MTTCLSTKNLNFYYGKAHVLHDINLEFEANKISALIGPSGSGKSTLLRIFNRIYELHSDQSVDGKVMFQGANILSKQIDLNSLRKHIGMVFQKPMPFPMSIFDNIAFALKLHEKKLTRAQVADRVEEALRQAALWDEVKKKLHEVGSHLSGGQQQRLCIARCLVIRPDILLLDEPTSALDPISTAKVESLVQDLKEKYSIILVTHNLRQAQRIADKTIFMRNGHVVEQAPTKTFFSKPKKKETKEYIETH